MSIPALLYHKENVKVTRATVPYFRDKLKILIALFAFFASKLVLIKRVVALLPIKSKLSVS